MKLVLRNNFHSTESALSVEPPDDRGRLYISPSQYRKARRALCGDMSCDCYKSIPGIGGGSYAVLDGVRVRLWLKSSALENTYEMEGWKPAPTIAEVKREWDEWNTLIARCEWTRAQALRDNWDPDMYRAVSEYGISLGTRRRVSNENLRPVRE